MVPARTLIACVAVLLACTLAGCAREAPPVQPDPREAAAARAFAQAHDAWRATRRAELLAPDGWTSLVGLHWITRGPHFVGSSGGSGIRVAMGPAELGLLELRKDDTLHFLPARGAALTLDGAPLRSAAVLRTDADPAGASRIGFDDGSGSAVVIERGDRHALRVRHANAATRTGFKGLSYWPASRDWRVQARFVPHAAGRTLQIANIVGTVDAVPNPGALEFEHGGTPYRLEALDQGDGKLFVVFADRTNGRGSYGAGRYLDAAQPDARGRVELDFNRSYNPPCAFTAFATCPLPPAANRLDLAVTAGEKAYSAPVL
jgi:uncharacterized protein (DUF1684 family)